MCFFRALPLALLAACPVRVTPQCVTSYPFTEDFESAPAWTVNGTAPDWAWGAPAHPIINSAGGGTNSWCVGGLTGSFYNLGQQSWIESGCYDLTGILHPWISFKIFWETERQYDGANLQYSLNGGATWTNVGAFGDPVDCLNDNWYNYDNVLNLTAAWPRHGWSGRVGATSGPCVGGMGSSTWLVAKHCLPSACANQPDVRFRFLFGAGTSCNNYDGVAIDDVTVMEAPIDASVATTGCVGTTVDFSVTITGCGNLVDWDFGDPASGAANTSSLSAPAHTFSAPGSYTVTAHVTGPCGVDLFPTLVVDVQDVQVVVTEPACSDSTGSATVVITGPSTAPSILWSPGGQTTVSVTGLLPGAYSVEVQDLGACTSTVPFNVVAPPPVTVQAMNDTVVCNGANLTLVAIASGGTGALVLDWSPAGPVLTPATAGVHTVVATDANGCTSPAESVTVDVAAPVVAAFSVDPQEGCAPLCVTFTDQSPDVAGNVWDLGDGTSVTNDPAPQHCYTLSGWYSVQLEVTDANGCTGSAVLDSAVHVFTPPVAAFTASPPVAFISDPVIQFLDGSVGAVQWAWDFGDPEGSSTDLASASFTFPDVGCYTVQQTVYSADGCADSTSSLVCIEDEFALYAPNAFTPDGDGLNDVFRPITTVFFPREYSLDVFDRWGQVIFHTTDPLATWEAGDLPLGVYVWKLRLRDSTGRAHEAMGHVTVVR